MCGCVDACVACNCVGGCVGVAWGVCVYVHGNARMREVMHTCGYDVVFICVCVCCGVVCWLLLCVVWVMFV